MRPFVAFAALALSAAIAPAAHACTIDNCVEANLAHATTSATDPHALAGECVVAGRAGVTFQVAGWVAAAGHDAADEVSVRCVLYASGTVVLDTTSTSGTPVATLSGSVVSTPNVRICLTATGHWRDGHTAVVTDCT